MFSNILSFESNFLVKFSFIFAWPNTKSFKEGEFKLKLDWKLELPPWYDGRG